MQENVCNALSCWKTAPIFQSAVKGELNKIMT